MIVVEGCDGAGKSTLVQHLSDKFGLEIGQRGVANRDRLWEVTRQDTYRALAGAVQADSPPKVWDRLWISEYVYCGINPKRPCEFNAYETLVIRRLIDALGAPFIVCLPPYDTVEENALRVHQMEGVSDNLPFIYGAYHSGNLPWPRHTIYYDYTGALSGYATLEDIEEEITGYIDERHGREAWAPGPVESIH